MIPEIEIWRAATLTVTRYGEATKLGSAERAEKLAADGHLAAWRSVAEQGPDQPGLDAAASRQWGGPVTRHTPACEQMYSSAASRAPIRCGWPVTNGWAIVQHFLAQQSK